MEWSDHQSKLIVVKRTFGILILPKIVNALPLKSRVSLALTCKEFYAASSEWFRDVTNVSFGRSVAICVPDRPHLCKLKMSLASFFDLTGVACGRQKFRSVIRKWMRRPQKLPRCCRDPAPLELFHTLFHSCCEVRIDLSAWIDLINVRFCDWLKRHIDVKSLVLANCGLTDEDPNSRIEARVMLMLSHALNLPLDSLSITWCASVWSKLMPLVIASKSVIVREPYFFREGTANCDLSQGPITRIELDYGAWSWEQFPVSQLKHFTCQYLPKSMHYNYHCQDLLELTYLNVKSAALSKTPIYDAINAPNLVELEVHDVRLVGVKGWHWEMTRAFPVLKRFTIRFPDGDKGISEELTIVMDGLTRQGAASGFVAKLSELSITFSYNPLLCMCESLFTKLRSTSLETLIILKSRFCDSNANPRCLECIDGLMIHCPKLRLLRIEVLTLSFPDMDKVIEHQVVKVTQRLSTRSLSLSWSFRIVLKISDFWGEKYPSVNKYPLGRPIHCSRDLNDQEIMCIICLEQRSVLKLKWYVK